MKPLYSAAKLEAAVARMGRQISRDYAGRTLDVVAILENAFVFAADLMRHITCPVVLHFVRAEMREVQVGGFDRREIFFTNEPDLHGRDVLLVDAVLHSGVTLDFLAKRLQESKPRTLKVAALFDKPKDRRVELHADYSGFQTASNYLVGYGLARDGGLGRNLPFVGSPEGAGKSRRKGTLAPKKRLNKRKKARS
ncbi:MAG: hypoxanthine phosphoribosyltransferase [Acidobacteria bacterium]|nr:hypoxanthine phosphoribosyltransferase [Acidobacteriota bacterium]